MTGSATAVVLAYHGCDEVLGRRVVSDGLALERSEKEYDWLGPGVYFWENDPVRSMEWAISKASRGQIDTPFVIGAVVELGRCLDLLLREHLKLLSIAYESFALLRHAGGLPIPANLDPRGLGQGDKLLRFRDCAVIKHLHTMIEADEFSLPGEETILPFDSVRGLFVEGAPAYPGGGFYEKTHVQIAVRTDSCIKGPFIPRHPKTG